MQQVIDKLTKLRDDVSSSNTKVTAISKSKDIEFIENLISRITEGTYTTIFPGEKETLNLLVRKYILSTQPVQATSTNTNSTIVPGIATDWLAGKTVVFTGFRDQSWEDIIKKAGGRVGKAVSRADAPRTILICKDTSRSTTKMNAARQWGADIVSRAQFANWLKNGK